MNFGHFSTQNNSVKVEISNQVKCHTAQRSRRGAGAQGRRRGGKSPVPRLEPQLSRAREAEGRPRGVGGSAPLRGKPRVTARRARPRRRARRSAPPAGPAAGPRRRRPSSQGSARGAARPATLPASRARKGPAALSCLVSPPAAFCNPIPALRSAGSRRPARRRASPRPAL